MDIELVISLVPHFSSGFQHGLNVVDKIMHIHRLKELVLLAYQEWIYHI